MEFSSKGFSSKCDQIHTLMPPENVRKPQVKSAVRTGHGLISMKEKNHQIFSQKAHNTNYAFD